ncbi:homocysteine-responsive endoplasmic reticulum-resident ubiquitin-like domain member 2 protein isoform X2 [Actinia tenebrosa]|uniref:Homocysteine-responsive endoplasmic reticulum-resident ubiquitin-like domain member 2 protein isoform X2 n=1 Tax=Actinia tenebrosa TaxID=6105 RepID=A0A6P8I9S9_ACTTE|nr:homocysteine-responsive endoplasmic reticulum-resident ubiquitin-like domain member 2 protein isoform X2 [Actinia tenebrosa]
MDGLNLDSSVTLIVKTPNKTIDDLQINCALDWTVRKIKQHLSSVYPSKPESKKQRLIYSGQLLNDNQTLKDFLREHQDGKFHTVHLVCPPSSTENISSNPSSSQETNTTTSNPTIISPSREMQSPSTQTTTQPTTDGVRYRGHNTPTPSPFTNNPSPPQMWNMNSFQGQMYPPLSPPNHQQWMQHMHNMQQQYQQMFQQHQQQMAVAARQMQPPFMNMPLNMPMPPMPFWPYQGPMMPGVNMHPAAQVPHQQVPPQTPPPPPPQAQNAPQAQQPPQPRNQEVRMNAQGGIGDDDEEEENLNNDWLDKIYTLCRITILLSIVWFYSSTGRFLMLILSVMVIYMYQWGVFQWLLRNRNPPENHPLAQPNQEPQQPRQEEGDNAEGRGDTEEGTEANDGENIQQPPPPPPGPSAFRIAMSFVSSFFTSLVPHHNDGIPAN